MIEFVARVRGLLAVLALVIALGYGLLAALEPHSATAAGVFMLALEGAAFLLLHVCRRKQ